MSVIFVYYFRFFREMQPSVYLFTNIPKRNAMMIITKVDFLRVGFLLTVVLISPSACQPKCLLYLDEVREVLSSKIPPINDSWMTDNYYNISRALYSSVDLSALYVRVTIQFLKDYQNGTKTIDDQKRALMFTWSKACSYVSVQHLSLHAMSVFSLATICPQRRQTELVITVPPFCRSSPYARNDDMASETWRYIVSTLEDVIINPKVLDPRLNTVCVVSGHEGNIAEFPKYWFFYWFILASSFLASLCLWIFLLPSISANMENKMEDTHIMRKVCGGALRITCPVTVTVLTVVLALVWVDYGEIYCYLVSYTCLSVLSLFFGCFCNYKWFCRTTKCAKIMYLLGAYFLFPCLFQIFHQFLWVVCGIISDPFWAIPIFLLECLFFASILFASFLYEKEFASTDPQAGKLKYAPEVNNVIVVIHLFMCWVSFALVLATVALIAINNGIAFASPRAGAIESILAVILVWLLKKSNLDFWSSKDKKSNQNNSTELEQLNQQAA